MSATRVVARSMMLRVEETGTVHELKVHPPFFQAIAEGRKAWELRFNDRNFKVGDRLRLCEYDPGRQSYTGRQLLVLVTYMMTKGFGLPTNYVVMSIVVIPTAVPEVTTEAEDRVLVVTICLVFGAAMLVMALVWKAVNG